MRRRRSRFIEPSLPRLVSRQNCISLTQTALLCQGVSGKISPFHAYSLSFDSPDKSQQEGRQSMFQFPSVAQTCLDLSPVQGSPLLVNRKKGRPVRRHKTQPQLVLNCVSRCVYKSRPGYLEGKPHNQDAFLIQPKLQDLRGQYAFGVFDGHGTYGREISHFLKTATVPQIEKHLTADLETSVRLSIKATVAAFQRSRIESRYSGSTLNLVVIRDDQVVCGNIGDSCSVLGRKRHQEWNAVALNTMHTLGVAEEKRRVLQAGGRISPCKNTKGQCFGPERVWTRSSPGPGLAISRSIGDWVAHSVGVSDEPEITSTQLTRSDKFLVLATDGLWQLLTQQEAVELVGTAIDHGHSEEAVNRLLEAAVARTPGGRADDITVIVVFFNSSKLRE